MMFVDLKDYSKQLEGDLKVGSRKNSKEDIAIIEVGDKSHGIKDGGKETSFKKSI